MDMIRSIRNINEINYRQVSAQEAKEAERKEDRDVLLLHAAPYLDDEEFDLMAALNVRHGRANLEVTEFDEYIAIPEQPKLLKKGELLNPLIWWKDNQCRFPILASLTTIYLCIPVTSAPTERLFSTGGNTVTKKRTRFGEERTQDLLMIHQTQDLADNVKIKRQKV